MIYRTGMEGSETCITRCISLKTDTAFLNSDAKLMQNTLHKLTHTLTPVVAR
jgi:hypothetical protein